MAQPSDAFKIRSAYFHSLSRTNTEATQNWFESKYKSAHSVRTSDVWADTIPYCGTQTDADTFATNNPTIVKKYTQVSLTEVAGSNGQAWYLDDGGTWMRPWISPTDIPNSTTNEPSYGFEAQLYREDGTQIPLTEGIWVIDYYAGIVRFQEGYTPADMGWGTPKITVYVYVGETLETSGGVGVAGNDQEIQFNQSGSFGASQYFKYDYINNNVLLTDIFEKYVATSTDYSMEFGIINFGGNDVTGIKLYADTDPGELYIIGDSFYFGDETGTNFVTFGNGEISTTGQIQTDSILVVGDNLPPLYGNGSIRYNSLINDFEGYINGNWVSFTKANELYPHNLTDHNDVVITTPQIGEVLSFDGTNWVNQEGTVRLDNILDSQANHTVALNSYNFTFDASNSLFEIISNQEYPLIIQRQANSNVNAGAVKFSYNLLSGTVQTGDSLFVDFEMIDTTHTNNITGQIRTRIRSEGWNYSQMEFYTNWSGLYRILTLSNIESIFFSNVGIKLAPQDYWGDAHPTLIVGEYAAGGDSVISIYNTNDKRAILELQQGGNTFAFVKQGATPDSQAVVGAYNMELRDSMEYNPLMGFYRTNPYGFSVINPATKEIKSRFTGAANNFIIESLGLGHENPDAKLHIQTQDLSIDTTNVNDVIIESSVSDDTPVLRVLTQVDNSLLTITGSKIGIGTEAPSERFIIFGDGTATTYMKQTGSVFHRVDATDVDIAWQLVVDSANRMVQIQSGSGNFIIENDGKIGINTTTVSEDLNVNGAIKIGNAITTEDGVIAFTGTDFGGYIGNQWYSFITQASGNIELGTPPDGTYEDGLLDFQPTDQINYAIDEINEVLVDLAPEDAEPLSGDLQIQQTTYTGYISGNLPASFRLSTLTAGTQISTIVNTSTLTFLSPSQTDTHNKADQGVLRIYVDGSEVDSFDYETAFDEANRLSCQTYTPANSPNGYLTITSVCIYNNFRKWQKGNFTVNYTAQNGERSIKVAHDINGNLNETNEYILFYDPETGRPSVSSGPNVNEGTTINYKYLSGVRFYGNGTEFKISFVVDKAFEYTYVQNPVVINYIGQNVEVAYNDPTVSGVSDPPNWDETMTVTDKIITVGNVRYENPTAIVTPRDPFGDGTPTTETPPAIRLIDGINNTSGNLVDNFDDEVYRLPQGNYDTVPTNITGQWDSTSLLTNGNAQVYMGKLIYPHTDYTSGYLPTQTADYSGFTGDQEYYRAMKFTTPHTNGSLQITGISFSDLGTNVDIYIKLPSQTGWLDTKIYFNAATFTGSDGDGCLTSYSESGSVLTLNWTSGTFSTANSGDMYIIKIVLHNTNVEIEKIEEIG